MGKRNFLREAEERQARIDALIDAYERDGTRGGGAEIKIDAFPGELKFAMRDPDGRLWYRGRILVPVKQRTPSKQRHAAASQADIEASMLERQET